MGIGIALARRIAIAAQGLAEPRPMAVDKARLLRHLRRTPVLQIDSVSVLARAHYLPAFSRLGSYSREELDQAAWGKRPPLFEYWAHEASLLPLPMHRLLRWRMARAARLRGIYGGLAEFARDRAAYVDQVCATIAAGGPAVASDLEGPKGPGGWWGWSDAKRALEYLFWAGRVTVATRRGFERVYDLPERVLPAAILAEPTPPQAEAFRALLGIAGRALGIATAFDLREYFRLDPADAARHLPELVETGELLPVAVEGWAQPAYLHRDARLPRRVAACALISPFDPLMWERPRAERLFDFHYRLEIYTPAHKRQHGYYVLPFLLGDRLVARVDLKADRPHRRLRVLATHAEPHAPPETAERLAGELRTMAGWLGLEHLEVAGTGNLAHSLQAACLG